MSKKTLKVLIFGITGDVVKKKVLPGLVQFAQSDSDNYCVELIGYSRSFPNEVEIQTIINQFGPVNLPIQYIQGAYAEAATVVQELVKGLKVDERLIAYVALPPSTYIDVIEQFKNLPSSSNFDVILEKPYATSLENLEQIIKRIDEFGLSLNIHFFDHYLFKQELDLLKQKESEIVQALEGVKIAEIEVAALETLGVEERLGYYDKTGAINDMLPHLLSLFTYSLDSLPAQCRPNLDELSIQNILIDQYEDFRINPITAKSKTETYFDLKLAGENCFIAFTSGKKLATKATYIKLKSADKEVEIELNIYPDKQLKITKNKQTQKFDLDSSVTAKSDHYKLLENLINKDNSLFLSSKQIHQQWELINRAHEQLNTKRPKANISLNIAEH